MSIKNQEILNHFGANFFEKKRAPEHTLMEPLETMKTVTVRPISIAKTLEMGEELDQFEVVSLMTGLSEDELEKLSTPDWNVIVGYVNDFRSKSSYQLANRRYKPKSKRVAVVFVDEPYFVDFEVPSVGLTRALDKEKDTTKRLRLYLTNLTNLSSAQIDALPLPDYNMLDSVVADFLSQRADYFA